LTIESIVISTLRGLTWIFEDYICPTLSFNSNINDNLGKKNKYEVKGLVDLGMNFSKSTIEVNMNTNSHLAIA